ncbi:MAG: ribosome maturation factor RimM [Bacteroidota bacterium]
MHNETIQKINVGYFIKPHGVFGTLQLSFEEGYEDLVEDAAVLFAETDGILVPWFVAEDGIRITSSKTALVDLDWIEDDKAARKLSGSKVWIESAGENHGAEFSGLAGALTGYSVFDSGKGLLGQITELNDYSGNIVLTVEKGGRTWLVPFHPDLIGEIDEKKKTITFDLPEGLTDI